VSHLTPRESELVALGAALGSNCIPCMEHHIPQARKAGLTDAEIDAAIRYADKVRQVPARKVLETALNACADRPADPMAPMTSRMMSSCKPEAPAVADGHKCC